MIAYPNTVASVVVSNRLLERLCLLVLGSWSRLFQSSLIVACQLWQSGQLASLQSVHVENELGGTNLEGTE